MRRRFIFSLAPALLAVLCSAQPLWAQGFMVKPMRMDFPARPGEAFEMPLELRQTSGDEPKPLDLILVELTQDPQGNWSVIEPGSDVDTSKLASCKEWVELSATNPMLRPMEPETVMVTVRVPQRARGVYFAGLIAQTRAPENQGGLAVVVRFLIPIVVEIQGRPERQNVSLAGMEMTRVEPVPGVSQGSTTAAMRITNEGRTYSRLKPNIRIQRWHEGRWRPVSAVDLREVGIIPGVTLNLTEDIAKRLPSGKYRLTGTLNVDGRRLPPLDQEIEFEGDPSATTLAVDTALMLDPEEMTITGAPGAMRTAVLQVSNESEEAVKIDASAAIPPSLRGVALGELTGDSLSAAEWLQVSPANFQIRGGGKQNVRVVAKLPREGMDLANYYGLLTLKATYPDGQGAGETSTLVRIENPLVSAQPNGEVVRAGLASEAESRYIVNAKVANVGNVHVMPAVRALLLTGTGDTVTQALLEGEMSQMLPLESRTFAGVLDFASVEDGSYLLRVDFNYTVDDRASAQMPVRVTTEDGQKVVTMVEMAGTAETPEGASGGEPEAATAATAAAPGE